MKCPNCGGETFKAVGGKDICPGCGYGSAALTEAQTGEQVEFGTDTHGAALGAGPRFIPPSSTTRFGFKLFAEILKRDLGQNVLISPPSLALALGMVYNGARGETRRAMATALELGGMAVEEVNRANTSLMATLENTDSQVQLVIANSLWASEDATFKPEFTQICQDLYRAQVLNLDFADPQAPSIINRWVNETTNGKIDQIIEEIQSLSILFIINALYFKGDWTVQFDRAHTREGLFTLSDGGQKRIQMMSQSGHYPYYRGKDFQAVSLPYGQGRLSMYIFLPDRDSSLAKFMESLASEKWEWWLSNLQKTKGDVALPRFRLEYELDLNDALKALGMEKAFNQVGADFGGMCPIPPSPNIYISKVLHKTFIEVNEEGTEAAAVTSVEMAKLAMVETFTIEVDRPFFCAIRDNQTGTVLFIGSITEPYREAN